MLEVRNLSVVYPDGTPALQNLSISLGVQEVLGIIGESGSGKSTLALAIMRLLPPDADVKGEILYNGKDVLGLSKSELERVRGTEIAMIFQDALSAFDPLMRVGPQIIEKAVTKRVLGYKEAQAKAVDLMRGLGVTNPEARFDAYPHELSGGLRQRAFIAMGLFQKPKIIILDEPTSALDVITQAQLIQTIRGLKEGGLSMIFITHDIALASTICDRVAVLYAGKMMEYGSVDQVIRRPIHPYTQGLIESTPTLSSVRRGLKVMKGYLPNLKSLPSGCRFHPRCPFATGICRSVEPEPIKQSDGRLVACHMAADSK